jgi:hypothetical protein
MKHVGLSRENLRKILVGASRVHASNMWGCHEKLLKKNISGGITGSCTKHAGMSREIIEKKYL